MRRELVMGTALLLPLLAAAADFTPLAVKPGLWEVTITSKTQLPESMLANIPPERRAQVEAMMAGRGGAPTTVIKSCLTTESLSRALNFNSDPKRICQNKLITSSPTKQEIDLECTTDKGKAVGKVMFEALSSEAGRGTMQMSIDTSSGTIKSSATISSRYLGPDCGDVKPR